MTYGLPEFLASKDHQILVMLLYALVVLGVPLAVYFLWVRKDGKSAHPLGVDEESVNRYAQTVNENMGNKFLIEPFALATEFAVNASPAREAERVALLPSIKDRLAPPKFDKFWPAQYAAATLTGYMSRKTLGVLQQADLPKFLASAHPLLAAITEIAKARHQSRPYNGAIDIMQHIAQAMWFGETDLMQLPYIGMSELVALGRKNIRVMPQLRVLPEEEVRAVLAPTLSAAQITEVMTVAKAIPSIDVDLKWHVPGAEDICENDAVHIDIALKRLPTSWYFTGARQRPLTAAEEAEAKKAKEDEEQKQRTAAAAKAAQESADSTETKTDSTTASTRPAAVIPSDNKKANGKKAKMTAEERAAEDARIDALIENFEIYEKEEKKETFDDKVAPLVHAPSLPFTKREVWYVALLNIGPNNKEILVDARSVKRFEDAVDVKFVLQAPPKPGNYIFEIQIRSDSYVGCDLSARFPMIVKAAAGMSNNKRKKAAARGAGGCCDDGHGHGHGGAAAAGADDDEEEEDETATRKPKAKASKAKVEVLDEDGNPIASAEDDGEDEEEEEEEEDEEEAEEARRMAELNKPTEELPGKWYFLGAGSFLEMLVNVVVLGVVGFYAYNFLHSRGLWQKWFEPVVSVVWKRAAPLVATVNTVTAPVTTPVLALLTAVFARFLGTDAAMPEHIRREKLNKMKSQRNRRTPFA